MVDPEERDSDQSGPHTQRNPGTKSEEQPSPVESQTRRGRTSDVPSTDTLLSAPAPASGEELALEQRLSACERKLDEVLSRLSELERRPLAAAAQPDRSHWVWFVFLAGLALAWQILNLLR